MRKETFSVRLLRTLMAGKSQLSSKALTLMTQFVEDQRVEGDVSFKNKNGEADLYYTVFGWLLSYIFGIELDALKRKAYLNSIKTGELGLIHYAALMRCFLLDELMDKDLILMALIGNKSREVRSLDSFHEVPQGDVNNPYSQFVWQGLLEDTNQRSEGYDVTRLATYHIEGKGYANSPSQDMAYLNATAAALAIIGQRSGWKKNSDVEFLQKMQEDYGGFKASANAPIADLLSTATALFVLKQYKVKPLYDASDFITSHWLDNGGFAANLLDETSDVEYVFYGLLALGTI